MSTNESFNSYPSQYPDKNSYSTSILNYPGRELVEKCISKVSSNIQDRINKITNKIKENQELSWDDREFLIMLYNFAVRIARYKGYMEAAELLERYLEASAEPLEISSEIYENSLRVQNEMYKQRSDIKKDLSDKKLQTVLRQSDLIYAEQNNPRFKYVNNRFYLKSLTSLDQNNVYITWRVDSKYKFESFSQGNKYSEFEYQNQKITIADGLSEHLVQLNLAKPFVYFSKWVEEWNVSDLISSA